MTVLAPNEVGLTLHDRIGMSLVQGTNLGDPRTRPVLEPPGFIKTAWTSFVTDTVIGGLAFETAPYAFNRFLTGDPTVDPNFNPYDLWDDEYAAQHPYMAPFFANGKVLDFPNQEKYYTFERRVHNDLERRELISRNSMAKNFAAMVPGQIVEAITFKGVGKVVGLGGRATAILKWQRKGTKLAQIGKAIGLGASANWLQEVGLYTINPSRNVDEKSAQLMAIASGGALAGLVPILGGAFAAPRAKVRGIFTARRIRRIQGDLLTILDDPKVKVGLDEIGQIISDDKELLDGLLKEVAEAKGAVFVEPRTVTVLDHPDTTKLLAEVKSTWGDKLTVSEHPQQLMTDWILQMQGLHKSLDVAQPAAVRGTGRWAELLSVWAPGAKLRNSPAVTARKAGKLFFDDTNLTREMVADPLGHARMPHAEGLKWNYNHWHDLARLGIDDAFDDHIKSKGGIIQYVLAGGERVEIKNSFHRRRFYRAVQDYMYQLEEFQRGQRAQPDAPPAIRKAGDSVRGYFKTMGQEAQGVKLLEIFDPKVEYTPHRWKSWVVSLHRADFVGKAKRAFLHNRDVDYRTGDFLVADDRAVIRSIIDKQPAGQRTGFGLDADERRVVSEAFDFDKGDVTEGSIRAVLGDSGVQHYLQDVDAYMGDAASSTADTITRVENGHGLDGGAGAGSVFKHRVLEINPTDFAEFLEDDIAKTLGFYHRQTSGRIATRLAIKRSIADWAPVVKKLTGKDLAEVYDPELILESIARDFENWLDVAKKSGNKRMLTGLERARNTTGRIMAQKLAELEGRPVFNSPALTAGWKLWAERASLRMPYMAYLGKVAISSIPDLAGTVFYKGLTPRKIGIMARAINLFKVVPRRGLEGLDVALADSMRSLRAMSLGDVADLADTRAFGPGLKGKFLQTTDAGMDWMARKFSSATLLNRWNTNMKTTVAHLIIQEVETGTRRMAKAAEFVAQGVDQKAAFAKAGLRPSDAVRLNRLGFNAKRSKQFLDILYEHGVAESGEQPWRGNRAAFDAYKNAIFPEVNKWWNSDRGLAEIFNQAVNSEVQNIIVEPKLLSKPLMNATWLGRVFNQFQSFAFAWGNQFAQVASQRPAIEQAQYFAWVVGLGGMSAAIKNQLSGRRSFAETAELWQDAPLGMVYESIDRSGLTGWLARPLGWLEKSPVGPAKVLGVEKTAQMTAQIQGIAGIAGPFPDWLERLFKTTQRAVFDGELDRHTLHTFRTLAPFQNLWTINAAERLSEAAGLSEPYEF